MLREHGEEEMQTPCDPHARVPELEAQTCTGARKM